MVFVVAVVVIVVIVVAAHAQHLLATNYDYRFVLSRFT